MATASNLTISLRAGSAASVPITVTNSDGTGHDLSGSAYADLRMLIEAADETGDTDPVSTITDITVSGGDNNVATVGIVPADVPAVGSYTWLLQGESLVTAGQWTTILAGPLSVSSQSGAFTYSPTQMTDSSSQVGLISKVRFLVGDTNPDDFDLTDDEILFMLAEEGSTDTYAAAAFAARRLASQAARLVDRTVGSLSISYSQRVAHFTALAQRLDEEALDRSPRHLPVNVFAGGMSKADIATRNADTDRTPDTFTFDQDTNTRTTSGGTTGSPW